MNFQAFCNTLTKSLHSSSRGSRTWPILSMRQSLGQRSMPRSSLERTTARASGRLRSKVHPIPTVPHRRHSHHCYRYASPKAFEAHTNSEAAQALHTWLQSVPIFSEADQPTSFSLQYLGPEFEFSRPEATQNADPHVIFAELDYSPGGSATAVPYWKAVVETGRGREPGTLAYGVMRDLDQEEKLATFEAYESADYLKDDHVASDAIAASIANTKHLRTGLKQHLLKRVLGFLYKD